MIASVSVSETRMTRELVARKARQRVVRLQHAAEPPRDRQQDRIACGNADLFVDLLETVDVDARSPSAARRVDVSAMASAEFEPVEEQFAIGQAGQIVVHGVVQQALFASSCSR